MTPSACGLANPSRCREVLEQTSAPFAARHDTMHLDVVRPGDMPGGGRLARPRKEYAQALVTEDIAGARPTYPHRLLYASGPPEKGAVPGAAAAPRWPPDQRRGRRRPADPSLTTSDIERAQPSATRFRTPRVVDPLQPRYDLPSHTEKPATPPRAAIHEGRPRDTMELKGEPTQKAPPRREDGAQGQGERRGASTGPPAGTTPRDPLRTVEQAGQRILSSKCTTARATCPLDPRYSVAARTTHPFLKSEPEPPALQLLGPVEGAAPRRLHRDNGEVQASLFCKDLPGAAPQRFKGQLPFHINDPPEVTPYSGHLCLDCSDIEGAQPGTRKPGTF